MAHLRNITHPLSVVVVVYVVFPLLNMILSHGVSSA